FRQQSRPSESQNHFRLRPQLRSENLPRPVRCLVERQNRLAVRIDRRSLGVGERLDFIILPAELAPGLGGGSFGASLSGLLSSLGPWGGGAGYPRLSLGTFGLLSSSMAASCPEQPVPCSKV